MRTKFSISFWQEWNWLLKCLTTKDFNILTFRFIVFDVEIDKMVGEIEIELGILGMGLYIVIPFKDIDEKLTKRVEEFTAKGKVDK